MNKRIIFTGGGSAGHVAANLVLIPRCIRGGWEIHYIGSEHGIERQLVAEFEQVHYHAISTGKLRRYFAWANVTDVFKIIRGVFQASVLLKKLMPDLVFSQGGFVAVPVILGAKMNKVAAIIHESDVHPGLANKISLPFAATMCTTFPETRNYVRSGNTIHVGAIVKEALKTGKRERGLASCHFGDNQPVLLIMGGSQGAQRINNLVRSVLRELLAHFQVIHICGRGKTDASIVDKGYKQFEYVSDGLPDLLAAADVVVSRAGSNSIHELLVLHKPMLLIPHASGGAQTGQILNAENFQQAGYAKMLLEAHLTGGNFMESLFDVYQHREAYIRQMKSRDAEENSAVDTIMALIRKTAEKNNPS
ncbi:undecaprenyldiphospho-muramoylpentapeptide beta-N-acetylglucosaminyltransferase [Paenibacillus sp. OSY-SE]|uniref:undecaprenyldiphospho-muramoylpentapeptide beta-N-acetylglucosaminyltransferase n=1 Tax=Paenibacillus sp. OSY-SE TaxID=1196323 RepID=UPI000316F7AC|nr:undecaprenyldiphospho-muramoylpentapeptide beta-N-acetylglucosaminyltransferase [Paenibacillus sp. OSY-SE]